MTRIIYILGGILPLFFAMGCNPFDKENLGAMNEQDVFGQPQIAEAYVNDIYADFMPGLHGNPTQSTHTDEAVGVGNESNISEYLQGTITSDSYDYYPYAGVRKINFFLDKIDDGTIEKDVKNRLKGEVLFWRAWAYFGLASAYGGVPLILSAVSPKDTAKIFVPRAKTSECYVQIEKDLNDAINLLPAPSGNARIDKAVAMAFKGRVLLTKASPQFNRSNNRSLWQEAYDANKAAVNYLQEQEKGLNESFSGIWSDEMNKEVIMVRRYSYPHATNSWAQVCMQPMKYAITGCTGANLPSLELVEAFPMKDGSKWDPNVHDYAVIHENRDDRFYATIAYNGAAPYLQDMYGVENMWTYWYDKNGDGEINYRADYGGSNMVSFSSFYPKKLLDPNISYTKGTIHRGEVDWVEIRYAEVIMNLAEAANELDKNDEALNILYEIRERAGINIGTGNYGITASNTSDIRQAIKDERFVEFAFETKRFHDLRRWRDYKNRMEGLKDSKRHGLRIEWPGLAKNRPKGLTDINDVWDEFNVTVIEAQRKCTLLEEDKYSFFGIPKKHLDRNSRLKQNNTWGGSFDPLQ